MYFSNRYGGDHDPALRNAARQEFIRTFAPPRTGDDVYSMQRIDLVDLVIMDERYYRCSPLISGTDRDAILGPKQWRWLEQQIAASRAPFLVISSSTTFHTFGDESWEQYPTAFERLRSLLRGRRGAMIVSGDVHRNAVYDDSGVIEIVCSGVARNGIVFGAPRKNYAILTFNGSDVRLQLMSTKAGWRFDLRIPLDDWVLP